MSTSSVASQTQDEERRGEDVVRVKDETLKESQVVCSVAAQTREEECTWEVAVHVKVESLLEDTLSTHSVPAHTRTEEPSREVVCEDPSWIGKAACSVSAPTQEKRPMVLVRLKVEPLLEDSLTHAEEEACSVGEVAVKEEPLWTETQESHSIAHTRAKWSRKEALRLLLKASCSMTMTSQEAEEMQKETATCSTTEDPQNEEEFSEVVRVKGECSLINTANFCGVSEAATLTGLYAGHAVKDELVVSPECLQPPDAVFTRDLLRAVRRDHSYATERAPVELELLASGMKACRVKLERCDRLLAPRTLHTEPSPSTRTNMYECDSCANTYPYKNDLVRHIQTHLKSKVPKSKRRKAADTTQHRGRSLIEKEKTFSCQKCSKKFTRLYHLERHDLTHEGLKPHICQICNKGFRQLHDLKSHVRTHTGEKPYSCDICNKKFSMFCNLTAHKRIHLNLKPYICEICNNRFRESSTLLKHKRTHTREKLFHCTICRKSFKQPYSLTIHQRIHSGEKPYSCEICMRRFSRRDTLHDHVLAHAGSGPRAREPRPKRKLKKS